VTSSFYDTVAYPSRPFWTTHPYSLGAMAKLFGMLPAPVERCRVLEIGCGEGGNLLPMAAALPQSTFLGFDLAGEAVAKGSARVRALSLRNIELKQMDILEARDLGQFDYLIAHGIYTWVPPAVQQRLLEICAETLAPQGVAYISYNVYPGGYVRESVRDLMLLHTSSIADPYTRVDQARKLLQVLAEDRKKPDPWHSVVRQELDDIQKCSPEQVFHDEFAGEYHQLYFKEFIARAQQNGLDYLAEAELADMTPFGLGEAATEMLTQLESKGRIEWEQYLDFFRFRKFRRTLLCRKETEHRSSPDPHALHGLYLSSRAQQSDVSSRWNGPDKAVIDILDPQVSAVMQRLSAAWPQAIPASDLIRQAPGTEQALLDLCTIKFIGVHAWAPPAARADVEKPCFSWFVRAEAPQVTNLYHEPLDIQGDLALSLVQLADGTLDRKALIAQLAFNHPNHSVAEIAGGLDRQIAELARLALLTDRTRAS
jgi:SAM-dependent methyltransferase